MAIAPTTTLVVAILGAWWAYRHYHRQRKDDREARLNALFAELANIFEHFFYVKHDLPDDVTRQTGIELNFRWSVYGDLQSTEKLDELWFLDASEIRSLLQLRLRVRNNDIFFSHLASKSLELSRSDLIKADERIDLVRRTALHLMKVIGGVRPQLSTVADKLAETFPL